jgi:catechol 2,3-dioxygenase-like lactoylglutathione lyase family enzyme
MKKKYAFTLTLALLISSLFAFVNKPLPEHSVDTFSISLNVKDLAESKSFYEKLGFTQVKGAGSLEQKWMLMQNGAAKVGLFQGMFPQNTITLNPSDARSIYQQVKSQGLETTFATGMDQAKGPASFALIDPDGNPILVDQH